ncbi:DmX-like protein 1, partial [Armadillidium nasatum]
MRCHQILTGACNAGDRCFAVGSVEGVSFTAYAAGCNIVILAKTFERVQVIPGVCHDNVQISCLDCSTDTGKIAAAYGKVVCIFEPTPLLVQNSSHRLDYRWIQTGKVEANSYIHTLSWNMEGTRLLTGGGSLQIWAPPFPPEEIATPAVVTFDLDCPEEVDWNWVCTWVCNTSAPTTQISFSPDGTLFATCSSNDRLVKIWYDNKLILSPSFVQDCSSADFSRSSVSYGYVYLPHPSAVTGFSWRSTSKYMPKGSVSNMLVTSCRDNICRIWVETVLPDDGLVSLPHIDPIAAQNPRFRMHRHKHRFMQRLKHIKTCFQMRKDAKNGTTMNKTCEPLPTLPSMYSIHDFHMYGVHASGVTPGFHFHLAATVNAETDIPLVPRINGLSEQNFVSKKAMDKDGMNIADQEPCCFSENEENRVKGGTSKVAGSRPPSHMGMRTRSLEEEEGQSQHSMKSYPPLSAATSSTSIATDVTMATTTPLGDALERKIEALLRDWLSTADMIFSIHPVDGSLLMWMVDFLDGTQGSFRQAQVSFCARLPSALPLGDAMTMAPNLAIYNGSTPSIVKMLIKLESLSQEEDKGKRKTKSNWTLSSNGEEELSSSKGGQGITGPSPIICLTTKHSNGSLNLWHLTVAEGSRFTQVLNISHFTRVCGHRFHLNDIMCHPVLPSVTYDFPSQQKSNITLQSTIDDCIRRSSLDLHSSVLADTPFKDWCSELILWRVDAVGPLSKSGGVTELARINSPQVSAFSNVAWIPTLLPSTTLGRVSNSPSACFVASDGECLRVYQAVIDGRVLLAEISTAERKKRNLMDIFNVVSEQSTARPGCIIQLDAILDATNDWQHTQFLHVFQEALILGEKYSKKQSDSIVETEPSAIVDLHSKTAFEEPFYVTLLEKTQKGSVMHMWRLVIASQQHEEFHEAQDTVPPPDDMRNFKNVGVEPKGFSVEASPIIISTSKIYCSPLPLPAGVEIVHSCPAAGHLSSASIYPACFAPYVLVTACSDNMVRFWRCRINGGGGSSGSETKDLKIEWQEWSMISKERKSAIKIPGEVLHVNAAYSGRIAVAYQRSPSDKCVTLSSNGSLVFSSMVSVYECESTGGSEWILRDTIELKDVIVNQENNLSQEIDFACLSHLSQGKSVSKIASALSNEDLTLVQPSQPLNHIDHLASQMSVPSASTLKSLRCQRHENSSVNVKQKHPIQLDWLSMENGSHLLTVAIGSKILVYTCISEDVQHINVLEGSFKPETRPRPVLQKSVSMHQLSLDVLPRWMRLDKFSLATADGLSPLPMRISWVRDGILIIGMDNEMQICTQWHENDVSGEEQHHEDTFCEVMKNRDLTQHQLMNVLKDSSSHHPKSVTSMSRITSYSVLSSLDNKMKKGLGEVIENPIEEIDEMSCAGIYELSHLVSPVLPQYHPKQLMELLNSGKIRRVKAILAHLLRCLMILGQRSVSDPVNRSSVSEGDHDTKKSWSRSRTLSITAGPSASGREGRNSITVRPEELTLDYVEIKAIPPLPLWLLLEADKERTQAQINISEKKQETYAELFEITTTIADDSDDLNLDDDEPDISTRRKSLTQDNKNISFFGPRQAQYLSGLLTHTHLPGLSSLDQMHLLALADTVASCNVDFADKFDINRDREAMAKEVYNRSAADEPSMDSLDDCGLRFLLAMRQHTYLLRCLPIGQRAQLQKAGIGCHNIVWAFHSESHDELLDFIPAVRQVAKAAFLVKNDPLDAAIYYLAMQKKSLVWGLFRSINDGRMTDFFANNFTVERWRKAALKNAFALMGKQRFEHAAAFFLLAGALKDAVEVALTKLNDEQLAFVITRLYEGELVTTPPTLQKLLYTRFLGCDENGSNQEIQNCHPDPFLRSMSYWLTGKYNDSLNTLLISDPALGCDHSEYKGEKVQHTQKDISSVDPTVFNFYIYLRTHPLLIRQCIANTAKDTSR